MVNKLSKRQQLHSPGFSLDLSDIRGWGSVPPQFGGQVQRDKVLMGGLIRGGGKDIMGDLTLIDYVIN